MKRKSGERWDCEACGKPLIGAAHVKTGSIAPIEQEPSEGAHILMFVKDGVVSYTMLPAVIREHLEFVGVPLRMSHFATCPHADRFRKSNPVDER